MELHDIKISYFENAKINTPSAEDSLYSLLAKISEGKYKELIEAVRNSSNKEEKDAAKKKLPAVTFSGLFSKRNANSLVQYSTIICHDVDNIPSQELIELKRKIANLYYVFSVFVSPSGNGLKVLFKHSGNRSHIDAWTSVGNYLKEIGIQPDPSCKDICRLCFVSYDKDLYFNEEALEWSDYMIENYLNEEIEKKEISKKTKEKKESSPSAIELEDKFLQICHDTAVKKAPNTPGSFNAYINLFALYALRYDIDEHSTAQAIAANCGWTEPNKDDLAVIRSVANRFGNERGIWKEDYSAKKQARKVSDNPEPKQTLPSVAKEHNEVVDTVKFWYAMEKKNSKGETIEEVDTETGELRPKIIYQLSYDNGIQFLENNGFFKIKEGDGYRLVRVDEELKRIEIVNELELEEFMLAYLKSQNTSEFMQVREIFRKNVTKYCSPRQFAGLNYYFPSIRKDNEQCSYMYFKNCFVEVTADGATIREYNQLDGYVWKKQIIDFEYTHTDWYGCDFHKFIMLSITGKDDKAKFEDKDLEKYMAAITGIGYMLHRYKNPAITKAVLLVDKKTRSNNDEMNGGSGKSIYGKAIGKLLNMFMIDGQNFNFDDQFAFDGVSPETEYINFNDVKGNFPFQRLFGMLTEDFSYRGLYAKRVIVPYEQSPKFLLSTNFTLRGDGESILRRQHIIEFTDYFNSKHTPFKEFGRMFFNGWDAAEWNKFYSFFIYCITTYLKEGLCAFPIENYELRKLLEWNKGAGIELNDYLNETILQQSSFVKEFEAKLLYKGFCEQTTADVKFIKMNTFSAMLKLWARINKLDINAHKNGERDRRNGTDYLTFTAIPNADDGAFDFADQVIEESSDLI